MQAQTSSLSRDFQDRFELRPALDQASRDQVFYIRHEVYCRDLGWEPLRADGLEQDEFDDRSVHCLLTDRLNGEPVGCVRLVLSFGISQLLPFEISCEAAIDRDFVDPMRLDRLSVCEVSRLAIMRNYRQRKGEAQAAVALRQDDFAEQGAKSRFPFIPVGLYLGAAAIARHLGRNAAFTLTEPRMAQHFGRLGLTSRVIGGAIDHRGLRIPSMFAADTVHETLRPMIRPLFDDIETAVGVAMGQQAAGDTDQVGSGAAMAERRVASQHAA